MKVSATESATVGTSASYSGVCVQNGNQVAPSLLPMQDLAPVTHHCSDCYSPGGRLAKTATTSKPGPFTGNHRVVGA